MCCRGWSKCRQPRWSRTVASEHTTIEPTADGVCDDDLPICCGIRRRDNPVRNAAVRGGRSSDDLGSPSDAVALHPSGYVELVQVCADVTDAATRTREIRTLVAADCYPGGQRRLLTRCREVVPDVPAGIEVMPAYEWLLSAAGAG